MTRGSTGYEAQIIFGEFSGETVGRENLLPLGWPHKRDV